MSQYTEDTLIQQTTADYLERLGWQSPYAFNDEDFGAVSLLGQGSDREVVLIPTLREKLEALNPGLPAAAYEEAPRQITANTSTHTLAAINQRIALPLL